VIAAAENQGRVHAASGSIELNVLDVERKPRLDAAGRRILDICGSTVLLLLVLPVIVVAAIVIKRDSPASGPRLTSGEDHRFTRVGAWLAHRKLDELPQLWHVLRGEMSLVGPRPEDPEFVEMMRKDYEVILRVRPGMTGFSQLAFVEESDILDPQDPMSHYLYRLFPQKLAMDKMYATKQTLWLNIRILFWTFVAVLMRRKVAVHRDTGAMSLRMR
jgi:lipopolysaccharide/colanic/teichoic acid biosynthesis glycosyltransferase